jgi:hypothetical protein
MPINTARQFDQVPFLALRGCKLGLATSEQSGFESETDERSASLSSLVSLCLSLSLGDCVASGVLAS